MSLPLFLILTLRLSDKCRICSLSPSPPAPQEPHQSVSFSSMSSLCLLLTPEHPCSAPDRALMKEPSPSNPRGWVAEQWGKAGLQHKAAQLGVSLRKSSCLTKQQDSSASLPVSQQPSGYTKQKWEPFQFLTQGRKLKINNFPPAIQLQQKLGDFQSQSLKELLCGFQPLAQSGQTLLHLCPASLGLVLSCRGCQLGFTGPTAKPATVLK